MHIYIHIHIYIYVYIYIYIYTPHNWGRQLLSNFLGVATERIVVWEHYICQNPRKAKKIISHLGSYNFFQPARQKKQLQIRPHRRRYGAKSLHSQQIWYRLLPFGQIVHQKVHVLQVQWWHSQHLFSCFCQPLQSVQCCIGLRCTPSCLEDRSATASVIWTFGWRIKQMREPKKATIMSSTLASSPKDQSSFRRGRFRGARSVNNLLI